MKTISLNIRSFKIGSKDNVFGWAKRLFVKEQPSFIALQETKLHLVDINWIFSLWGGSNCNFIQKEMLGKSGGQLLIWDTNLLDAKDVIHSDFFIEVKGTWKNSGLNIFVINVYGPHDDINKRRFWASLQKLIDDNCDDALLICGDFNEVRNSNERLNCDFIEYRARAFNDFISCNVLIDVPLGGRNFTRISEDGLKFSKINRFLVNDKFHNAWVDLTAIALERQFSDHCPIVLKDEYRNFGPKPFKVFDVWFHDENIESIIKETWKKDVDNINRKDCIFRNRLKNVKNVLREHYGKNSNKLDDEIECLKAQVQQLELKADSRSINNEELILWREKRKQWLEKDRTKTEILKQKARVRWILEGDENTTFFHSMIRRNNTKNNIRGLKINGVWNDSPKDIKDETFAHFKRMFEEPDVERPSIENLSYPTISTCMGFGGKWRKWIFACLSSASISVLINGSPTNEFNISRGVRQGDPLSPFLFIIAAEGLNILTKAATNSGLFRGVEIGADKILVSHLQYADDTIFIGDWSRSNAYSIRNLLKCFELASGLKLNFQKSCLYGIGVDHNEASLFANGIGCQVGKFPFTYLGLPIGSKMKKVGDWNPVIEKFKARLSKWRMRTMSFDGRMILIKSILNSLP
ncbi:uncharacterized protein [Rutidosis leptorrhynchoides]|uniref:uncharacterized protein n=1 Tax=Rutidosis leptorrhynchoides TaxID=125765 RepID=UPI003A99203A